MALTEKEIERLTKEFEDFYEQHKNDEFIDRLPFPDFLIAKDPVKYGEYNHVSDYEFDMAVIKFNKIAKENEEEADKFWKEFIVEHEKKYPMKKQKKVITQGLF